MKPERPIRDHIILGRRPSIHRGRRRTNDKNAQPARTLSVEQNLALLGRLFSGNAYGAVLLPANNYVSTPLVHAPQLNLENWWRIELKFQVYGYRALGLNIRGDTLLGRDRAHDNMIDIDLDPYGAFEKGVSRQHAILRPSSSSLYLIDLESTNGTSVNGIPLSSSAARRLLDGDILSFGQLGCTIRILDRPTASVAADDDTGHRA
jgi:hypothetical protein